MTAAKKPRMGRPPLAKKARKAMHLSVRFTEQEHTRVERAAVERGLKVSEWVRLVILEAAGDGA